MCVIFFFQFEAKLFPIAIQDAVGWSLPSLVSEREYGTLSPEALGLSGRAHSLASPALQNKGGIHWRRV